MHRNSVLAQPFLPHSRKTSNIHAWPIYTLCVVLYVACIAHSVEIFFFMKTFFLANGWLNVPGRLAKTKKQAKAKEWNRTTYTLVLCPWSLMDICICTSLPFGTICQLSVHNVSTFQSARRSPDLSHLRRTIEGEGVGLAMTERDMSARQRILEWKQKATDVPEWTGRQCYSQAQIRTWRTPASLQTAIDVI